MNHVLTHSSRRINAFAEKSPITRYLEVGVETGATFFGVNAEHKFGVDPNFLFDETQHREADVFFAKMESDVFFRSYQGGKFDFIFLDGLHLFEQIARDFTNSLMSSHAKTVIMIDDVFPTDVYSSLRDWNDTMELRNKFGSPSGDWHGDVYKMLFLINDLFPALSFAVMDDGVNNRQLVVWRKQRALFLPVFNDISRIAHATYFDLLKNYERFNPLSEADVVNRVIADLA